MSGQVVDSGARVGTALDSVVKASLHEIDRHCKPRYKVRIPCRVMAGQQSVNMAIENLSEGGAMLGGDAPDISRGVDIEMQIEGFSQDLKSQVRNRKPGAPHIKFDAITAAGAPTIFFRAVAPTLMDGHRHGASFQMLMHSFCALIKSRHSECLP